MLNKIDTIPDVKTLDELCPIHNINLVQLDKVVKIAGEDKPRKPSPFCPECTKEGIKNTEIENTQKRMNSKKIMLTYEVFKRDSTIPKKLADSTFANFIAKTEKEKDLLLFMTNQATKYLSGMRGNTLVTGTTGIGKSHLSIALAKAINEGFNLKGEPKSVLFISLTEIIKRIQEGWGYGKGATVSEYEIIELLKSVDYLILDDLGAKNAVIKPKSDWEQDFLFNILNNRENTIINTNLTSDELMTVYNDRNYSRILEGLKGNIFKADYISDKRYTGV